MRASRASECAASGISAAGQAPRRDLPIRHYNYLPFDNLIEKTHQYQFYGELNAKIGDETDFHVEAMFAETNLPKYRVTSGYPPSQP